MNDSLHPEFDDEDTAFDTRARAAGRSVREPAPRDGIGRVRSAKRRRSAVQVGTVVAVGALAVGGIFAVVRTGDDSLQSTDDPSATTLTTALTTDPTATDPSSSADNTQAPAQTNPAATSGDASVNTTSDSTASSTETATPDPTAAPEPTAPAETVDYVPAGQYAGPGFDERTSAITSPLADGLYFSSDYTSNGETLTFRLIQRLRGQACVDEFGDAADEQCASDSGTLSEPSATITMAADTADTSVIFFDNANFLAYRVPADEFISLAAGQAPSAGAPAGYSWERWGTYVTVQGGRVVSAHQQFSS